MSSYYYLGFIVGFLLVFVIIGILYLIVYKSLKIPKEIYDERQMQARGIIFRNTYFLTISLLFLISIFSDLIKGISLPNIIYLIILISVGYFCINSILKDAYAGINQNFKKWGLVMFVIGIINLLIGTINIINHLNNWIINMSCGILLMIILVTYMIKNKNNSN